MFSLTSLIYLMYYEENEDLPTKGINSSGCFIARLNSVSHLRKPQDHTWTTSLNEPETKEIKYYLKQSLLNINSRSQMGHPNLDYAE